jgi:hypothetical protein
MLGPASGINGDRRDGSGEPQKETKIYGPSDPLREPIFPSEVRLGIRLTRSLLRRRPGQLFDPLWLRRSEACGLTDPPVVSAILLHLELPHKPPPISPARGPPQGDFLLDQTPAFDLAHGEPIPEFVFDQSLPDDFDD